MTQTLRLVTSEFLIPSPLSKKNVKFLITLHLSLGGDYFEILMG